MASLSTIDMQIRLDVLELLAQYCHALNRGEGERWALLFTSNGQLNCDTCCSAQGREALAAIAADISRPGHQSWRFQFSNVVLQRGDTIRELEVEASCLITDWAQGGKMIDFWDCRINLKRGLGWQIESFHATSAMKENEAARASSFILHTAADADASRLVAGLH